MSLLAVIAMALVAVAIVLALRPDSADQPASITMDQVIGYSASGAIERIEVRGSAATVRFREGFDTATLLGAETREFQATVPAGQDMVTLLEKRGVAVNVPGGVQVSVK